MRWSRLRRTSAAQTLAERRSGCGDDDRAELTECFAVGTPRCGGRAAMEATKLIDLAQQAVASDRHPE